MLDVDPLCCAVGVLVRTVRQPPRTMGHWFHWIDISRFSAYVSNSLVLGIWEKMVSLLVVMFSLLLDI